MEALRCSRTSVTDSRICVTSQKTWIFSTAVRNSNVAKILFLSCFLICRLRFVGCCVVFVSLNGDVRMTSLIPRPFCRLSTHFRFISCSSSSRRLCAAVHLFAVPERHFCLSYSMPRYTCEEFWLYLVTYKLYSEHCCILIDFFPPGVFVFRNYICIIRSERQFFGVLLFLACSRSCGRRLLAS
jgi:hypothetical protein